MNYIISIGNKVNLLGIIDWLWRSVVLKGEQVIEGLLNGGRSEETDKTSSSLKWQMRCVDVFDKLS